MKSQTIKIAILSLALICLSVFLSTHVTATDKDYCQACGKEVSWQLLTEDAAEETSLAEGHYRLSFSGNSSAWIEKTVSGHVCIDLNGMTVQGINRVFTVPKNATLSIQGEGYLIGGGFAPETTNTERIGAVGMVQKGGKLNLYSGTLRTALYAPENVYSYNGGALWVQGQFHMYGGRVEKGTATNAGGNVFIQTGGEMRMYDGVLTGGDKRDLYCKGSLYLEGKASPGVSHLTKPELTISGLYTGYLVVSAPELIDGMVLGVSENAQLRYGNISVSHSENRLFLIEKDGQLILSQYQPDHPETIESRYCQACGRYADFVELTEYSGFMGAIRTGHYYLNFPQGSAEYEGMTLVLKDRVCLDLNGMTVYYPSNGFDAQTGCIINVMDSVGGGALRRLENATDTPMVILAEAAELNLYGGSLVGAGNGDRFVSAPNGKIGLYGGEVKKSVTKAPMSKRRLIAKPYRTILTEAESYDVGMIRVYAADEHGNIIHYCSEPIKVQVEGDIELIGPDTLSLSGGMTGIYVKTVKTDRRPRPTAVIISGNGFDEVRVELRVR